MNRRIILAALAAALSAAGAPVFFPRAQFHYGLERTDYLHRWHDRPLYQDSTFADANDPAHPINEKSWRETVRALRLGKCGIGTFIDQRIRADVIPRSVLPGAETVFLAEFDSVHSGEDRLQHILRTAELAIAAPNAFRLDGRVVMTEYGAKTFTPEDLAFYDKVRTALAEKFGPDKFYVLPYAPILPKFYGTDEPVAPEILKQAEARLREMLLRFASQTVSPQGVFHPVTVFGEGFGQFVFIDTHLARLAVHRDTKLIVSVSPVGGVGKRLME